MKILISPAKSIDLDQSIPVTEFTVPVFVEEADYLAGKLKKMSAAKLGKLMHLSEALSTLNYERYQNWKKPESPDEDTRQCGFVFTGEVYKGMDMTSWKKEDILRGQSQIRILSGLYGLLKPLDLLYPYRLEMGTKWEVTPKTKNLYAFWKKKVTEQLKQETDKDEVIVNLASGEYFKAIDTKVIDRKIITPVFKDLKGDTFKVIMMYAKHARGAMARYIVEKGISDVEELKNYDVDGYRFHESLSSGEEWVFTR